MILKITGMVLLITFLFSIHSFAQAPAPPTGTKAGNRIAERVESQETKSSDQEQLAKEVAEAARRAGRNNPDDPEAVKKAVRDKLDEIKDREGTRTPGGKNNKEIRDWAKKLKRDLMDHNYISLPSPDPTALLISASGTGKTTGHVADLSLQNPSRQNITVEIGPYLIPSSGKYQPYIIPESMAVTVPAGSSIQLLLQGYCADISRPPVPQGSDMSPFEKWIKPPSGGLPLDWTPNTSDGWQPVIASNILIPGTDRPLNHIISIDRHPEEAAGVLLTAIHLISETYDNLKEDGLISTPFSGNSAKERESVIQQTFWTFAAALTGSAYKIDEFRQNTIKQFEASTGTKFETQPEETRQQVDAGVDDFWNTFQAVGVEAKILPALQPKAEAYLCYIKSDCSPGSRLGGSVTSPADCKALGGKSYRKGIEGECVNL